MARLRARRLVLHPLRPDYLLTALEGLIRLYMIQERSDDAGSVLWEVLPQLDPKDRPSVFILRLKTLLEAIEPTESREILERYLKSDPDDWLSGRALARMEQAVGNLDQADALIEQCLANQPKDPEVCATG